LLCDIRSHGADATQQRQVPARMKANRNFSDASLERLHLVSVSIIVWWARVMLLTCSYSWCMRVFLWN